MTQIDFSQLPEPSVIELIDYEVILADMLSDYADRMPDHTALLESDPLYKQFESAAYREMLIRQRVNSGALAVMLAYTTGNDLDHLAANLNVERKTITPADPDAVPPVAAVMEDDTTLKARTQLALEAITTAGSKESYKFHAWNADNQVKDASINSANPSEIDVYILAYAADGSADQALIDIVDTALDAEFVRPLGDQVTVQAATIQNFSVDATLVFRPGVGAAESLAAAEAALVLYLDSVHKCAEIAARSGIMAALSEPAGVMNVTLSSPAADIVCDFSQAPYCTGITLAEGSA